MSLLWSSWCKYEDNSRCLAISVINMTTIHPQRHVLSHDTNSELCAPGRKVQQWSMIKPVRAEAKFTWVCLCSAGKAHRDVRFSVHLCGWVKPFQTMAAWEGQRKTKTPLLSSYLLASIPCLCDCFWQARYVASSLLFWLLKVDKI